MNKASYRFNTFSGEAIEINPSDVIYEEKFQEHPAKPPHSTHENYLSRILFLKRDGDLYVCIESWEGVPNTLKIIYEKINNLDALIKALKNYREATKAK